MTAGSAPALAPVRRLFRILGQGELTKKLTVSAHHFSKSAAEKITALIPLKRLGEAADIAHMTAFLGSEEAGYITGQVFTVDGGMVM